MVTDRDGNPVKNLRRDDFELYENGERVDVKYFSRIDDGRLAGEPSPAGAPAPVLTKEDLDAIRTPVTWVVFVDQTNAHPTKRNQALRQLYDFMKRAGTPGDKGVVAAMDGVAFRIRQNPTDNWDQVLTSIEKLQTERMNPGSTATAAAGIRRDIKTADPRDREIEFVAKDIGNRISYVMQEEAQRTRNALQALGSLLEVLSRVDGRVAFVYVGAGFNTLPGSELTEAWRSYFAEYVGWQGAPRSEDFKIALDQAVLKLFHRLAAARITLYAIHVGDSGGSSRAEDPGIVPRLSNASMRATESASLGERAAMNEFTSAREIAESTGGLFFTSNPGLSGRLDAVKNDLNHYYSLGYTPAGQPGRIRNIKVRVKQDVAGLRYRQAVREPTKKEREDGAIVASLVQPKRMVVQGNAASGAGATPAAPVSARSAAINPLGVEVQADRPRRAASGRDHVLPFRFNLPLDSLRFISTGRAQRADLAMHFSLVGPDGTVWPIETREQSLEIPNAELAASDPASAASYAWHLDVSPLRVKAGIPVTADGMRLVVSVEDRIAQTRSLIAVPVPGANQ
jgi:VWFA-related protein